MPAGSRSAPSPSTPIAGTATSGCRRPTSPPTSRDATSSSSPPGAYLLQFQDPSGTYVDEYWDDAPSAATATTIQVAPRTDLTDVSPRLAARVIPPTTGPEPTIVGAPLVGAQALRMVRSPGVRGAVRRGAVLKVSRGSWKPVRPTLHWQWFAGGRHVVSADDRPLRLRGRIAKKLSGKAITVRFSVTATGYEPLAMRVKVRGRLR